MGKYFNVTKKIEIAASKQHSAFSSGNVLADWQAIQVPRGSICLTSVTMLTRPKGDASPTDNNFAADVVFAKNNTVSLGTVGGMPDHRPNPDIIGLIEFDAANYATPHLQSTSIAMVGGDAGNATPPLILTSDITTGDNVGYDTVYVGMLARDAWDFTTINRINDGDIDTSSPGTTLVCDGSSMDLREHFAVDDVLHAHDDAVIGVVASVDSATNITLDEAISTGVLEDDDYVYNLYPITLIFGFEK